MRERVPVFGSWLCPVCGSLKVPQLLGPPRCEECKQRRARERAKWREEEMRPVRS